MCRELKIALKRYVKEHAIKIINFVKKKMKLSTNE